MFKSVLINSNNVPFFYKNENQGMIKVDIVEKDKEFLMKADMPGAQKENISVDFLENVLTISVENKTKIQEEEGAKILKLEREYYKKSRSFYFEAPIDDEKIEAKYENGVLELKVPKKIQVENNKKIIIN